jgi:hypothetical protein
MGRAGHVGVASWAACFSRMPNNFFMPPNIFLSDYGTVIKQDFDTTPACHSPHAFPSAVVQVNVGVMIRMIKFIISRDSLNFPQWHHLHEPCHALPHATKMQCPHNSHRKTLPRNML